MTHLDGENIGWTLLAWLVASYFLLLLYRPDPRRSNVVADMVRYGVVITYMLVGVWTLAISLKAPGIQSTSVFRRTAAFVLVGWVLAGVIPFMMWRRRRNGRLMREYERAIDVNARMRSFRPSTFVVVLSYAFAILLCVAALAMGSTLTQELKQVKASWLPAVPSGTRSDVSTLAVVLIGFVYSVTITGGLMNVLNRSLTLNGRIPRRRHYFLMASPYFFALLSANAPGLCPAAATSSLLLLAGYRFTPDAPASALRLIKNLKNQRELHNLRVGFPPALRFHLVVVRQLDGATVSPV
jgi:hypothetical protein